jgi:hypothetical protein
VYPNTRVGSSNPGWSKRIEAGAFVASPYTVDRVDIRSAKSTAWTIRYKTKVGSVVSDNTTFIAGFPISPQFMSAPSIPYGANDLSKALSDAYSRLLSRIREENSEMNGLLMLGELRETIKMIRRPGRALYDAFQTFTSSAKRQAALARTRRAFMQAYSGLYLEWAFGWKPLLSDVGDVASTIVRHLTEPPPRKKVVGTSDPRVITANDVSYPTSGAADAMAQLSAVDFHSLSAQSIAYLKPAFAGPDGSARRLAELSGFSLENFVPTVYNLLPYSFLLDYASNLGDVIEGACTVQQNVQGVVTTVKAQSDRVYTTSRPTARAQASMRSVKPSITEITESTPPSELIIRRTSLQRTVGSSVPVPDLYLHLPGGQQSFNMLTLINGFAANVRPPRR